MTEMIKKHTVERTANWETICHLIDQTKEMLQKTKTQSRIFVCISIHFKSSNTYMLIVMQMPHFNTREQVPLGSSSPFIHSANLFNSYEHENAAEEHEQPASAFRMQGIDTKPTQFDDAFSRETSAKRTKLGAVGPSINTYQSSFMSGTDSGSNGLMANSSKPRTGNGQDESQKAESSTTKSVNGDATLEKQETVFFNDVNPTPMNLERATIKSLKRGSSPDDNNEGKKPKKTKTRHIDDEESSPLAEAEVEFEDISQEVDARLKEKEEKRKRKKEKKRKSTDIISDGAAPDAINIAEGAPRSKKKKKLRHNHDALVEASKVKKRSGAGSDEGQGERRKKKHKKIKEFKDS